ncbi:MAG: galactose mutarotase [Solobacterium sp.]|nr:galactose mutarotase [Solobacterium sp.]
MSVRSFGFTEDGQEVLLYTLENDAVSVSVMNYGAAMVSLVEKSTGRDILLGHDSVKGYIHDPAHMGGFIGRTANRIKNGRFRLNGETYQLDQNSGENNLHGGSDGFDQVMYEAEETGQTLRFHRISPDGEMGYPGDLDVTVTYTLLADGVQLKAEGTALNKDTLFAITNHNYYSLDDSETICSCRVTIPSDRYAECSSDGISQLPLKDVTGTVFDFRDGKELGTDIRKPVPQLIENKGYDHHWEINGEGMRTFAVCRGKNLELKIESDMPGMHMYTANFLDGAGKQNRVYHPQCAVCFEPEYIPNGINYEGVKQPIVHKGETSVQTIRIHIRPL